MHRSDNRAILLPSCRGRSDRTPRCPRLHRLGRLFLIAALGGSLLLGAGCTRSADRRAEEVIVTGSTTILPIAEQAAEKFEEANEGARVLVSGLGSSAGIEAVSAGTSDIGTASRDLKAEEERLGLVDTPIAFDGIAVIVHPDNPVTGLTTEQLRGIFAGDIVNWSEVGGADRPINLVNRDEASGTREAFSKIVMGETDFDRRATVLPGTGQVRDVVARSAGAIGYISVGFVEPRFTSTRVKALPIDGVVPSDDTVATKEYPIARTLHCFTKGAPTGLAKEYLEFMLSDEIQRGVVVDAGFVPVSERPGSGD